MRICVPKSQWNGLWSVHPFAQVAEKLAQNRLTLLAAARRQLVEPEAELLGPVQLRADRRTDGMQPAAGLHSFEFVHGILF